MDNAGKGTNVALPQTVSLPSGLSIPDPTDRMLRFCREEYPYYDGLPSGDPDRIEPLDVLATVAVNGFYNANARRRSAVSTEAWPLTVTARRQ
jgi:hypothetical protein